MARQWDVQYVNFYTAGSAAVKYEPTPIKKQIATLPKPHRKKKIRVFIDPVAVGGVLMAVVMLVMMVSGIVRLNEARTEQIRMQEYVQQLQEENTQLKTSYEAGYDADEIYEIATAMGMIPEQEGERITLQVSVPQLEEAMSPWENFCAFLTGLFA